MTIEFITKAYLAENLTGSCFTAPLRGYNACMQNQIQTASDTCERIAWRICHIVTAIFAYPMLGALAIVGIAVNLCLIAPEKGYSLWARLNGIPDATEKFCNNIRSELLLFSKAKIQGLSGSHNVSSTRQYAYNLHKQLAFDIQNVFEEDRLAIGAEGIPYQDNHRRMQLIENHIRAIEDVIRKLSQEQTWYPEHQWIRTVNGRATVVIPIPDHITLL